MGGRSIEDRCYHWERSIKASIIEREEKGGLHIRRRGSARRNLRQRPLTLVLVLRPSMFKKRAYSGGVSEKRRVSLNLFVGESPEEQVKF